MEYLIYSEPRRRLEGGGQQHDAWRPVRRRHRAPGGQRAPPHAPRHALLRRHGGVPIPIPRSCLVSPARRNLVANMYAGRRGRLRRLDAAEGPGHRQNTECVTFVITILIIVLVVAASLCQLSCSSYTSIVQVVSSRATSMYHI